MSGRRFFRAWFILLPLFLLAGCFLPTDFELRISIQPNGDFEERFRGLLVEWGPYERWKRGEFSAAEADRRSKETLRAVTMDSEAKPEELRVREESPFHYRVEYLHKGNVFDEFKKAKRTSSKEDEPEAMSFLVDMFYLRRQANGVFLFERRKVGRDDIDRFRRLGLEMKGSLTLRVHGKVIGHDAQSVSGPDHRWALRSVTEPSARMEFRLD